MCVWYFAALCDGFRAIKQDRNRGIRNLRKKEISSGVSVHTFLNASHEHFMCNLSSEVVRVVTVFLYAVKWLDLRHADSKT